MRSTLDTFLDYAASAETDSGRDFERVWLELGEHESSEADSESEGDSFWLECNGELADAASLEIVGARASALGVEMVEFVCPRCNQHHESLTFR
jgi:hypothetical protein